MAFEYLMSLHLLKRDYAAVVEELSRLQLFSYPKTPLTYEEAALLHAGNQREIPQMTSSGVAGQRLPDPPGNDESISASLCDRR